MIKKYNNIIITGAPGTGKTTLINAIKELGYCCFDEASRIVIKQEQELGGDCFPWDNIYGYSKKVMEIMQKQYIWDCTKELYFFDRAVPDVIAYLKHANVDIPSDCYNVLNRFPVDSTLVFFAPCWEAIYINDAQRPESIDHSRKLHVALLNTYVNLNYNIVMLPKTSVAERANFILQTINQNI